MVYGSGEIVVMASEMPQFRTYHYYNSFYCRNTRADLIALCAKNMLADVSNFLSIVASVNFHISANFFL